MAIFKFKPTVKSGFITDSRINPALVSEINNSIEDPENTYDVIMNNKDVYSISKEDAERLSAIMEKMK